MAIGVGTLAQRLAVLVVAVAIACTVLTGALLVGIVRQAEDDTARALLGRDAEVLAAIARGDAGRASPGLGVDSVRQAYARREIVTETVEPTDEAAVAALPSPLRATDVTEAATGAEVSRREAVDGRVWFVEARQAGPRVVLLAQPRDAAVDEVPPPRRRLVAAGIVGALGAALVGVLLARALARPLTRLDTAARRLSAGERDVRVTPEGPREIADVARALNGLADALAASEDRQRRFLLTVSHELRTPLTAVAGYGEALAEGVMTGQAARDAGRVVVEESARLQRRVEELLALARLAADDVVVTLAEVDVTRVVRAAQDAWRVRAGAAGIPLLLEAPPQPVPALADPERLRQAVDALADNALRVLEAAPPGGDGRRPPLVLAARPGDGAPGAVVEVRDGGPGLEPGELAVAFEPGRLSERYRGERPVGSGVGLALVARLAELMAGEVTAARAPEGGLAVSIRLPPAPR
ncbi:MAG: ATP-binding protein [Kineosporiaceae bacterium]